MMLSSVRSARHRTRRAGPLLNSLCLDEHSGEECLHHTPPPPLLSLCLSKLWRPPSLSALPYMEFRGRG